MVIAVLNPKGGCGKTTLATNLARVLQACGSTLLIDMDPQGSATEWAERNPEHYPDVLRLQASELSLISTLKGYRYRVIDGAAVMDLPLLQATIHAAHCVLIPVQPSGLDLWGTAEITHLVLKRQEANSGQPRAFFVPSRVIPRTRFAQTLAKRLAQNGIPVIQGQLTQRIDYAEAASVGLAVIDHAPNGRAALECFQITHALLRSLHAQN